jgi:hypothetical protein
MAPADIRFYFDPVCPFCWLTSKWIRMVQAERDLSVDWRFISLRLINEHIDYDAHFPPEYEAGHTAGLRLLRVVARARQEHGAEAVDSLQAALGAHIFDTPPTDTTDGPERRGTREFLDPILREVDLPLDLADALDDTSWDDAIRADGDEALALTGRTSVRRSSTSSRRTGWRSSAPSSADSPSRSKPASCGTTWSAWPGSPASPSSSAACGSDLSSSASAWSPAPSARRRTGTVAAVDRGASADDAAGATDPSGLGGRRGHPRGGLRPRQ